MVKGKNMPLKLTTFDIVPKGIQWLESPYVTAMMSKKALTGYQIILAVTVQITEFHCMKLAIFGFDPVSCEGTFATSANLLL